MNASPSKYYKLPLAEGLEALFVNNYSTPFPFHFHPTFNITLVYDGVFNTQLSDKLLHAPSGSILITNPQEIHANPCERDSRVSFFTFYISGEFLEYCNDGRPVVFNEKVIYDAGLFTALHKLSISIDKANALPSFEVDLTNTLKQLAFKHGASHDNFGSNKIQSLFDEFIAGESFAKFSLTDAAKRFGIDKYKFIRLFKFQTGLTPNNYFILKRIEQSKAMLADGQDLLAIAIDLGFYDVAHYANHFKKFTGISPVAYSAGR